jgi:hypothetical protein
MNVVKLLDKKMPIENPNAEFFNNYLKGKYAYWIQMRYIVPMEFHINEDGMLIGMKHEGYVACEEDIKKLLKDANGDYPRPYGTPYLDIYDYDVIPFVDMVETDLINSTMNYRVRNQYITDEDITIDELKKFRTWLATQLINMDKSDKGVQLYHYFNELEYHVLKYYAGGMYDETIKILMDFGETKINGLNDTKTGCGCNSGSNLSSLYINNIETCDPISIYKENLYNKMVQLFSNIEFWSQWPKEFILEMKKYIDNIVNVGLTINNTNINKYADCTCLNKNVNEDNIMMLNKLSQALHFIANGDIQGHKNYIYDALFDWSKNLYEYMEW